MTSVSAPGTVSSYVNMLGSGKHPPAVCLPSVSDALGMLAIKAFAVLRSKGGAKADFSGSLSAAGYDEEREGPF